MAEKRLSTLQIKYNDKTLDWLRENIQVLIFKSNVTKKKTNEVITLQLVIQTKLFKQSWHSSIFFPH